MSHPPSPLAGPSFSAESNGQHNGENDRCKESTLTMGALSTAARLGDVKTTKQLVDLGVAAEFVPDLDDEEKETLAGRINTKLGHLEQLLSMGILYVPAPRHAERNPLPDGMFKMCFIPGTDVIMTFRINPSVVQNWDPSLNPEGCQPLHYLVSLPEVSPEAVRYILKCNPNQLDQTTQTGYTSLILAILRENRPAVEVLFENGASTDIGPFMYVEVEELGSYYPYMKVFSPVKVTFPEIYYYFTPLEAAIFTNNEDILRYLVKSGVNLHSNHGLWSCLFHPLAMRRRMVVELLLENGADINGSDCLGTSPLHKAAGDGSIDLTYLLMRKGADINAKDMYDWTPLHVACLFSKNVSFEMIQLLLDGGADIHAKTKYGFTPLSLAEAGHDLFFLEYLSGNIDKLSRNSNHICMPEEDSRREHEDIMTLLLENGANCNQQDEFLGWTALHWAAASGDLRSARLLVSRGAEASVVSRFRLNPYQTALSFNRGPISAFLLPITPGPSISQ